MKDTNVAKVQHYVPQFLLRNFGNGRKKHVFTFDKKTGKHFSTNAKNIACESRFYDFEENGTTFTVENSLSYIEAKVKPIFKKITDKNNLSGLSIEDRAQLSVFFSIQYVRTRCFREQHRFLQEMLGESLRKRGFGDNSSNGLQEYLKKPTENDLARQAAKFIIEAPQIFSSHLFNKSWLLLETNKKYPFIIGDNPLTMQNNRDFGFYRNIGFAVLGIEIYFPLSPTQALAMWCPSHEENCRDAFKKIQTIEKQAPHFLYAWQRTYTEKILKSIENGCSLECLPENVVNFNALQVLYAEQYLFSSKDEFDLAQKIISDHQEIQTGPRPKVS